MNVSKRHDPVEAWFFNLESMAKRIEQNEDRQDRLRKRQWAALIFFMFAFLLLSYRSEITADRIDRSNQKIQMTQDGSCRGGLKILTRFNALQDRLIEIERADPAGDATARLQRIKAYEDARILPLPDCPNAQRSK